MVFTVLTNIVLCPFSHILVTINTSHYVLVQDVSHAIVGSLMPGSGSSLFHRGFCPEKISIVPRGVAALGYTLQLPQEDRFLMVEDELRGQIAMLLGGRSADSARLRQRDNHVIVDQREFPVLVTLVPSL